jgi:hypothetical protein
MAGETEHFGLRNWPPAPAIRPFELTPSRIFSPVIPVESDHQPGIVFENNTPLRDHIYTLVRTPNGKDLLRQHYLQWHTNVHGSHARGTAESDGRSETESPK